MPRIIAAAVCYALFGLGALAIGGIALPFMLNKPLFVWLVRRSWRIFVFLMELFRLVKVEISKEDRRTLNRVTGHVIVANHPSLIDIVILIALTNRPVCIVKGALAHNFFVKLIVKGAYISNDADAGKLIGDSRQAVNKGYNLIIFPEGTRTLPGQRVKLKRGAAHIAINSGAPILCLTIRQSQPILRKNHPWHDVGASQVTYKIGITGKINPQSQNARTLTAQIKNAIGL